MNALEHILTGPAVGRVGLTLLHSLWQVSLVAAMLAGALRLLRRRPAGVRYLVATAALLIAAAAPIVTFAVIDTPPYRDTPRLVPSGPAAGRAGVEHPAPDVHRGAGPTPDPAGSHSPSSGKGRGPAPLATSTDAAGGPGTVDPPAGQAVGPAVWLQRAAAVIHPALPHVAVAWVCGVLLLTAWRMAGWRRVRRLVRLDVRAIGGPLRSKFAELADRLQVRRPVRLLESAAAAVPVVIGYIRPVVLLPVSAVTGLAPRQLEAILAHELAHVRRHDYLVNTIQIAIETLLFYHPAVWWVSRRIREEREECCDDSAVAVCGSRLTYARALVSLVELGSPPAAAVAASGGLLLARIRRIVGLPADPAGGDTGRWGAAAAAALILVGLLAAGAVFCGYGGKASAAGTAPQPAAESSEALEARIARLIAQLGSATYADRDAAQKALLKIGKPAIPALKAAAAGKDPERAGRARVVLAQIAERAALRKETWRNRWERMSLSFHLSKPAAPDNLIGISIDPQGKAVVSVWDPRRKAPVRYESVLTRKDLDATAGRLGLQRPWDWHDAPKWKLPATGTLTLTITVEDRSVHVEQPWPPPPGIAQTEQNVQLISGLMAVRFQMMHLMEVVRRDATIRAEGGTVQRGDEAKEASSARSDGERTAIRKVLDLLSLPWQTKLTAEQLDEMAASIRANADEAVEAIMKQYNGGGSNSFRHRAVQVFERLATVKAQEALLDIALGRTADTLPSSHGWAARACLRTLPEGADARKLLAGGNPQVLNPALLALKGQPVDEALLKRIGEIVRQKEAEPAGWTALPFAAADVVSSDPRPVLLPERVDLLLGLLSDVAKMPGRDKPRQHSSMTHAQEACRRLLLNLINLPAEAGPLLAKASGQPRGVERDILVISRARRGDAAVREDIRAILTDGTAGLRRAWAARALGDIGRAEDLPLLKRLAQTDPLALAMGGDVGPPAFQRMKFHPVRHAAKEAFQVIEFKLAETAALVAKQPKMTFKASFESLAIEIASNWQWNRTITIEGDGAYVFDLKPLERVQTQKPL